MNIFSIHALCSLVALPAVLIIAGCSQSKTQPTTAQVEAKLPEIVAQTHAATGEELLAARLLPSEAADGWIRLFDGHTLFGWEISGNANWRVEDQTITVDRGDQGCLYTSTAWKNFELTFEFNADPKTNSGVFVRSPLNPDDVALECYEINIAPDEDPFPTASIVKRQKVDTDSAPEQTFNQWRRMTIRVEGQAVEVKLGEKVVCGYTDPVDLPGNRIGLQHNRGRIAFRDLRLKPLGLKSLLDEKLDQWKKYPDMPGEFTATEAGSLHVQGGRAQLESKATYDDFVLLAEYKMAKPTMNSGIFFRCIPGDEMMGYECQVSNERKDNNPLTPADCGTGGIFRRQDARVVAGDPGQWATVVLSANGPQIAAWVNGVPVSNWQDDRKPHENPRKGLRLEAGTLMIQGHDPGTDATFRQLKITP